jgi:hypothetical protein
LAAAGLLSVLLAPLAAWFLFRAHIDPATCARVKPGMTRAEVEALLGGPPGNYATKDIPAAGAMWPAPPEYQIWNGDRGSLEVYFDQGGRNGRVVRANFSTSQQLRNGPWGLGDWLRALIRLAR